MLRSKFSASLVSVLAATGLMATSSPADAATNRCGSAYSDVSKAQGLFHPDDPYHADKGVQNYRIRFVPNTYKLCVEFLNPNRNYLTDGHVIRIKDTRNGAAIITCGGLVCKWKSDDSKAYVEVSVQARLANDTNSWEAMSGRVDVKFVAP